MPPLQINLKNYPRNARPCARYSQNKIGILYWEGLALPRGLEPLFSP